MALIVGILLFTVTTGYFFGVRYTLEELEKKAVKFSLSFMAGLAIFILGAIFLGVFWYKFINLVLGL